MLKNNLPLPALFLASLLVILPCRLQAQNATAPAARQDTAANQTEERLAEKTPRDTEGVPVQIRHENTDRVGRRLVFHIRERFSRSSLFRLSDKEEKKIILYVKSQKEFPGRPGVSSIYAATWAFSYGGDVLSNYLQSETGIAGTESLGDAAEEFVARTYEVYSRYSYLFEQE